MAMRPDIQPTTIHHGGGRIPAWVAVSVVCLFLWACASNGPGVLEAPGPRPADGGDPMVLELLHHLHPIEGEKDLDPLLERVGDARLVLLGESTHGTSEFYTWRSAITRRLIAEHGFTFVAVEGDWGAGFRVNQVLKDAAPEVPWSDDALAAFARWPGWMWNNRETAAFLEWMYEHNSERHPSDRAAFHGMDLYGAADSLRDVLAVLDELDPERAAAARRAYACLERFGGDPFHYGDVLARGGRSCAAEAVAVAELLEEAAGELRQRDPRGFLHARTSARVVKNAERHIRISREPGAEGWNARVGHMADTVEALFDYHDTRLGGSVSARGIVWAHNTHVGDVRATAMRRFGQDSLGGLMRQRLGGEQTVLVGFGTHRGGVIASDRWGGPRRTFSLPRGGRGSVEDLFHRTGVPVGLVVFGSELRRGAWLEALPHRAVGVVYDPSQERQRNYIPSVVSMRYDAFIWIDRTSPLDPL